MRVIPSHEQGIQKYYVSVGLYSDRHTTFCSPHEKLTIEQELAGETKPLFHFGKSMTVLLIVLKKTVTPKAKGRVERLWVALQDRVVIELRLLGVMTMRKANDVLPRLLQKHNRRFAVQPKMTKSPESVRWKTA